MAHFAEIGINNVVKQVVVIDNIKCMNDGGIEDIDITMDYIRSVYGHSNFVKCSYNSRENAHAEGGTALRANYPGIGSIYDSTNDIFHDPRPTDKDNESCTSWTLNTTKGIWEPPITEPTLTTSEKDDGKHYEWDESVYTGDNTKGWILVD